MSAYETGTATNAADLWQKLIQFLTTDARLTALNQNWAVAWQAEDSNSNSELRNLTDIVLRGKGLTNQNSIYVGLRREDLGGLDASEIQLFGMTGVSSVSDSVRLHVNVQPHPSRTLIRNQSMNYWFAANGRRFTGVVRVGVQYEAFYAGFFLPYADPIQYPYPLFVGGSCGGGGTLNSFDWRSLTDDHSNFPFANMDATIGQDYNPSAWMLGPDGSWLRVSKNTDNTNVYLAPENFGGDFGGLADTLNLTAGANGYGYRTIRERLASAYGGEQTMIPITLCQARPTEQTFGVLDGVYYIQGRSQLTESLVRMNDQVHAVFQNVFRAGLNDFFAIRMYPEDSNSGVLEDSNS